jgi:hypothetical protein
MNNTNTGGPAFPIVVGDQMTQGMTLRDYFAAKAMQIMWDAYDKGYCGLNNNDAPNVEIIAEGAYQMADAMLKARKA